MSLLRQPPCLLRTFFVAALCAGCAIVEPPAQASPLTTTPGTASTIDATAAAVTPSTPAAEPQRRAEAPFDDSLIDWDANPVMQVLSRVATGGSDLRYSAATRVDEKRGVYHFDCSGMAQWVLQRAAPSTARASRWGLPRRPLAADYARRIARAPTKAPKYGWQRIPRLDQVQPGDVIAWVKPAVIQSPYTGHVAFIALPPVRVPGYSDAYLLRIIDSTSLLHDADTRQPSASSGFGLGTILVVVDPETGAPRAYGWAGLKWRAFETDIALGRATR